MYTSFDSIFKEFDILVKDMFDTQKSFSSIADVNLRYPVDTYTNNEDGSFNIEIALAGVSRDEVSIETENDILKIFSKPKLEEDDKSKTYYSRKIAKRSFKFAWKISSKYDIHAIEASLEKGILHIIVPIAKEEKRQTNKIEIK